MNVIYKRATARQDLVNIFRYYAFNASLTIARRFLVQSEDTFTRLAAMPGMGTLYQPDHPALAAVRYFPVARFPKYIVFYQPIGDGIEVIRILHGSRHIPGILAEEFGIDTDAQDDDL